MMRQTIKYTMALVGLYIVVYNGSKSGKVIKSGANGAETFIKTLQGR